MRRGVRLKYIKRRAKEGGGLHIYYGPPDRKWVPLPDLPENDPRFLAAYAEAAANAPKLGSTKAPKRGTVAALVTSYKASQRFKNLKASTRAQRSGILDKIAIKGAAAAVAGLKAHHIRKDLAGMPPFAAVNRRKVWRYLLSHAVREGWTETNVALQVEAVEVPKGGHRQWTLAEVAQYRAHHPIGTVDRLAFELAYWTGARRSDLVLLGRQMVDTYGWLTYTQTKTGQEVFIPLTGPLPRWMAVPLKQDHKHLLDALTAAPNDLTFLVTQRRAPHSAKAFGAWFKKRVKAAGLPDDLSLHGLRKARAAVLAELGWSTHRIGAWTGHESLSEVERYTKAANKRLMLKGEEQEQNWGNENDPVSHSSEKLKEIKG
ncbi:MAG: tyrosine-type recombinase/integrase [Pseudomonadota bacterium]